MAAWWERFPGRLEAELESFRERGLAFEIDDGVLRDSGRVLLRGAIDVNGNVVALEVLYPDLFPYFRPEVFAPQLELERHQNPRDHNLCLLDRPTSNWRPSDTGGWLVAERVPYLLSLLAAGPDEMREAEAPQGEPASVYFASPSGAAIFVPAEALAVDPERRAGSGRICLAADGLRGLTLRGLLCELVVKPRAGKSVKVAGAGDELASRFSGAHLGMRWARLDGPPSGFDADAIFAAADSVQAGFGRPHWQAVGVGELAVAGVVFPEEVRQNEYEDTWVFGVRVRRRSAGGVQEGSYVVRGERLTSEDFGARIPRLGPLTEATAAVAGLGAVGAPLALELARNQLSELRLLEHDVIEAAQTVRYPFGMAAVGYGKLTTVAQFIGANYPFTAVTRFDHQLGQTGFYRHGRSEDEFSLVERFVDGVDLVIDATAEIGVQQLHADVAGDAGLPQLYVSATEGARGGQIGLIIPGQGGCWYCWKLWASDGVIPLPPRDESGTVQPRGCASPTFTGASFDLLPIVAQAARVAADALLPARANALASTVWVCNVPADGRAAPAWSSQAIELHPGCPRCSGD